MHRVGLHLFSVVQLEVSAPTVVTLSYRLVGDDAGNRILKDLLHL
jgi:hypothetical protein